MIFAEGRLVEMAARDLDDGQTLAPLPDLIPASVNLDQVFGPVVGRRDSLPASAARLRRLDLASDLRFEDPARGFAFHASDG